jgi:hypothetical protein
MTLALTTLSYKYEMPFDVFQRVLREEVNGDRNVKLADKLYAIEGVCGVEFNHATMPNVCFSVSEQDDVLLKTITEIINRHVIEEPKGESFDALLKRAGMNEYTGTTGITRSTDSTYRIGVGRSLSSDWSDTVGVSFMDEQNPNQGWRYAHFSPARARVIAHHLIAAAERLEQSDPGMRCIDNGGDPA